MVDVPHQVPPPPVRFVNRAAELAAAGDLLGAGGNGRTRIAVLTGLPGVGKSALARQLVELNRGAYPGGELFVDFGGLGDGDDETAVSDALASCLLALGVAESVIPSRPADRAGLFRTRTSALPTLVVLDDVTEPAQVSAFRPNAPGSAVLVTSNARLTELRLDGADVVAVNPLGDNEASHLMRELCGERVTAEPDDLLRLTRECGGLPIALRVAAARLATRPSLTVRALADEIASTRGFSVRGEDRVDAVFSMAYGKLPAPAARLYRLLGAAPATEYTVELAAAVVGVDLETCAELVDIVVESGLLPEEVDGRFRPHTLVRRHAAGLAESGEPTDAARRLVWFLHQRAAFGDLTITGPLRYRCTPHDQVLGDQENPFGEDKPKALDWLDGERPNLVAAVRAALEHGWHDLAWQLAESATALYANRRYLVDWTETSELGARAARLAGHAEAEARLRSYVSRAWVDLGRPEQARSELDTAFELARHTNDIRLRASLSEMDGRFHEAAGDHERALAAFRRSLDEFVSVGDDRGAASLTLFIGRAQRALGQSEQAQRTLASALELLRAVGDTKMAGRALISIGRGHETLGHDDDARAAYAEAVSVLAAGGDLFHESWAREALADLAERTGDRRVARDHVARMVELHTRLGSDRVDALRRRLADLG